MNIEKKENGKELTLILSGRLDTTTAPLLEAELKKEYRQRRKTYI